MTRGTLNYLLMHGVVRLRATEVTSQEEAEKVLEQQARQWFGDRWNDTPTSIIVTDTYPETTLARRENGEIIDTRTTWDVEAVAGSHALLRNLGYTS